MHLWKEYGNLLWMFRARSNYYEYLILCIDCNWCAGMELFSLANNKYFTAYSKYSFLSCLPYRIVKKKSEIYFSHYTQFVQGLSIIKNTDNEHKIQSILHIQTQTQWTIFALYRHFRANTLNFIRSFYTSVEHQFHLTASGCQCIQALNEIRPTLNQFTSNIQQPFLNSFSFKSKIAIQLRKSGKFGKFNSVQFRELS